jgi:hypothetical protein
MRAIIIKARFAGYAGRSMDFMGRGGITTGALCLIGLLAVGEPVHDSTAVGSSGRCILPIADGSEVTPSPPNLDGVVVRVRGTLVTIRPRDGSAEQTARLTSASQVFSGYGGWIDRSELKSGQKVRAWFERCQRPKPGKRVRLAVLMVASTDPADDWPEEHKRAIEQAHEPDET